MIDIFANALGFSILVILLFPVLLLGLFFTGLLASAVVGFLRFIIEQAKPRKYRDEE